MTMLSPELEATSLDISLRSVPSHEDVLTDAGDCLVVGVWSGELRSPLIHSLDHASGGLMSRLYAAGELPDKCGDNLMLYEPAGIGVPRLLLIGLGKPDDYDAGVCGQAFAAAATRAIASRATDVTWALCEDAGAHARPWLIGLSIKALREADYAFDHYRQSRRAREPRRVRLVVVPPITCEEDEALTTAVAIANGIDLAKDLGNLPCNVCTPEYLARIARRMAREHGLDVDVMGQTQLEEAGLHAFLAVARGSVEGARLIALHHRGGAPDQPPIVLIGKGLTFDSGGISIKPAIDMDYMKYDMCGAAAVLGVVQCCAQLKLPLNIVALVPACENMPAGNAMKPGDVIRSLSGQHIEVINTDAEGRLVLCDAMTYAQRRLQPELMIDVATLTGACVIALGSVHSGLYANCEQLAAALLRAGECAGDTAWRMPMDAAYQEQINSSIADIVNSAGRDAGSITAACFLSRFAEVPWAHLDIAGTAWKTGKNKSGTGRPVALLAHYLLARAQARAA